MDYKLKVSNNTAGFRQKRDIGFADLMEILWPKTMKKILTRNTITDPDYSTFSYSPPSYSQPFYAPPTQPPVRIIYRKFGYVCEHIVSLDVCELPQYGQSKQYGQSQKSELYGQYGQNQLYEQEQPQQSVKYQKSTFSKQDVCGAENNNPFG